MNRVSPRVLLVNPPYQRLRGMLSQELPLGLLYIASVLRESGFETRVLNSEEGTSVEDLKSGYVNAFASYSRYVENRDDHNHPAWKEYARLLNDYRPDIVGFSVMTPSYSLALGMARLAKRQSGAFVVFGGPHPTLCPEDVSAQSAVDAVIVGEGEGAFLRLVKSFDRASRNFLREVPSAVFFNDGSMIRTPLEPLERDLDTLPYPDYDSLVRPEPGALKDRFGVVVSRGCPYRCTFCVDHLLWRDRTRFRTHSNVLAEIRLLYERYGMTNLFFQQDSFLNRREMALSVASGMTEAGLNVPWWCAARVDQIDEDLIRSLKRSGLTSIVLGIESGSQRILDIMNKKITLSMVERAVEVLKENGIKALAFFMIGIPDETEDDVMRTMAFMKKLPVDFISLSVFTPLPRSVLFDRCVELGLVSPETDWSGFDYQSPENYFCPSIRRERFAELVQTCSALVDSLNAERCRS